MEIVTIESFVSYYSKTRRVTNKILEVIPHDRLDFTYKAGKFTIGDLVRHIAAIERYVFAEIAVGNRPRYKGCGKELADGYDNIMAYFNEMHLQSVEMFRTISDERLHEKIASVDGREVELATFLQALIVHEVHHRGALCIYLNMQGVDTPPVIGLTEEQVKGFSI